MSGAALSGERDRAPACASGSRLGRPRGEALSAQRRRTRRGSPGLPRCAAGALAAGRARRVPGHLGAVHRLGHELRPRGLGPEGLLHHAAERPDGGGALLRRRQRLHARLRAHARREHGPRRVLPARRLHRAARPAQHGRRRRRRRPLQRAGRASPSGSSRRSSRSSSSRRSASLMQQTLLRWNQGQDLRQALITIAVSIILADQMLAHFGGVPQDISWPVDVRQVRRPPGLRDRSTR